MPGLPIGLFDRLDRHNAHGGSAHRFADRFRIAPIILVGLDVGLDILRVHQLAASRNDEMDRKSPATAHPQLYALPGSFLTRKNPNMVHHETRMLILRR
jgi:hypothetical protein